MDLGRHPRIGVWAAAAVLAAVPALAGCSSDSGKNGSGTTTSAGATLMHAVPAALATPTGDGPADPAAARAQVEKNWTTFFDSKVSVEEKVKVLENGELLELLLDGFAGNSDAALSSAKVTDVVFDSATEAQVTYDLLVRGVPVLPGSKGTAVLEDGVWKVSTETLCSLVGLSGNAAPGC
ncbi:MULTISPECIES: hypothetical protein [unclassified Streptomyces]|uniref:hypothetical protein n=1 Tax=unclassified Streptomyces TaxID=2593676 RepID=UPI002253427A|nr:hypothetical protein [Streptomyces sp. NBC_00047]MCX5608765.1 hypothetical protein [Streptomyces sp. NBC_00047]